MNTLTIEVYNMPHKILVLIILLSLSVSAQTNATEMAAKAAEDAAALEKNAIELLREASAEISGLRTAENRISFNAELASLMWFHNEKEAMAMYGSLISDFNQLLRQIDLQVSSSPVDEDEEEFSRGIYGHYGRSPTDRKMRIAMMVRHQIALSLAEHAPDLAFSFLDDSRSLISDPGVRKQNEEGDIYFEASLFRQIGEGSASKASDFGKRSIKNGIQTHHISLLEKIYAKDAEKGIEFGAEILSRLKSDSSQVKNLGVYNSLLTLGAGSIASKKGKKPLYEQNDLRDIANQFAQVLLAVSEEERSYMAESWSEQIDKFAPGRGAQIRSKYKLETGPYANANAVANAAASYGSNSISEFKRAADERAEREKAEARMIEDIEEIGSKPFSAEERKKVIAQARGLIARTPGKEKKIMALNLLAVQVMRAGDKDLAAEIMGDAERFLNPQPKNYKEFLLALKVASGYAATDPGKAFPLLEDMISRVNDTIAAAVKVAEFTDVTNEMVIDGEVQVGPFGASMVSELTRELGMANETLRSLAKADFARTRGLTNSFHRSEVRVLAKMMVLRAVLGDRAAEETDDDLHGNK